MELLKRIDHALEKSGKTRADLARELGISTQAISSLGKRPNATMKHENIVKAAQALSCSVEWLTTGKGPRPTVKQLKQVTFAPGGTTTEYEVREMRGAMVAAMFRDLPTDQDRDDVVAFVAERLAKLRTPVGA